MTRRESLGTEHWTFSVSTTPAAFQLEDRRKERELPEEQARDPRYVFACADRGWGRDLGTTDRLIKNTWEVLSYLPRIMLRAATRPASSNSFRAASLSPL